MNKELNIAWMYPDILNLHGDRGNLFALKKIGENLGISINIIRINNLDKIINYNNIDIMIFNPGELKVMPYIISNLNNQKKDLNKFINDNKIIILIGTSGTIIGKEVYDNKKILFTGLGYLDMIAIKREKTYGDDILWQFSNFEIIGNQIQIVNYHLKDVKPLGKIIYGLGNNNNINEGASYKNIIFTNTLGPVFIKNPWWTEYIIKKAMQNKSINISKTNKYNLEKKSLKQIKDFISKKQLN